MSGLTVVVLDEEEQFIAFLDNDYIDIVEENEQGEIGRVSVEYTMNDVTEAEALFKLGHKLLILNDTNLKDCLYVINTTVKRDYYKENKVSFVAEDKLVELNNVMFSQTELTSSNGFTIRTVNNEANVLINYNALSYWFGPYFNIGVVQDCLSENLQRLVITGTMTMMELLRLIEEETGNIFQTRYEKDVRTNTIHPYLDFLNPINSSKKWELNIDYTFYDTLPDDPTIPIEDKDGSIIDEGTITPETDDELEIDDIVEFPTYHRETNIDPTDILFQLWDKDRLVGEWSAVSVGMDGTVDDVTINLKYVNGTVTITINGKTFTAEAEDIGGASKGFIITEGTGYDFEDIILGNESVFRIKNTLNDDIIYEQHIRPLVGDVHEEVLDLGYNVENIEYEVDEEDTYTAIAPLLGGEDTELTRNQLQTVINRWINLEVEKGETIPMIVQRVTNEGSMTGYDVHSKYYNRPLKPNDQDNQKEYWVGTAYWSAPFTKRAGDIYIEDEEGTTNVSYGSITTRQDDGDPRGFGYSPKIGTVESSDEDPYAIYNDVAMKLREKKYPQVNLEVDVANLRNGTFNNYNLYDKVYIKVPGFQQMIRSNVVKTSKNAHDIGENTVELENDCVFIKTAPLPCDILVSNASWKYPSKKDIVATLVDGDNNPISNRLVSVNVNKVENEQSTPTTTTYNRKTDKNGKISLSLKYDPGDYELVYSFGGDVEYEPVTTTININVSGTKTVPETKTSTTKGKSKAKTAKTNTQSKKQYWTKYGVSPNSKYIMAVGRISVTGEYDKYKSDKFYRTIFYRKCPNCGSEHLYWSIYWGKNESSTTGKFPPTGKTTDYANKGLIVCKKCNSKYSVLGNSHGLDSKTLRVYNGPYTTKKTEAYTLKQGKKEYKSTEKVVRSKKIIGNNQQPKYTVDPKVEKKARSIVGNSTGIAAAKKIAKWCGRNIKYQKPVYSGFRKSARSVLTSRKGNCCDQTRLMLMMMDAVGVTQTHKLVYMHVHKGNKGHVFAKVNGKYVDPCVSRSPWGNYVHGYGRPGSSRNSVYPEKPF